MEKKPKKTQEKTFYYLSSISLLPTPNIEKSHPGFGQEIGVTSHPEIKPSEATFEGPAGKPVGDGTPQTLELMASRCRCRVGSVETRCT